MDKLKALILGVVVVSVMAVSTVGWAAPIYEVNRSAGCSSGCIGNITVQGFVEVNALGPLTPANFIDWELTFTSSNNGTNVLNPSNSDVVADNVNATDSELTITIDNSFETDFGIISNNNIAVSDVSWFLQSSSSVEFITNTTVVSNRSEGIKRYSDPFVVTLTAVPTPSAMLLMGTGLLGLIGYRKWSTKNN